MKLTTTLALALSIVPVASFAHTVSLKQDNATSAHHHMDEMTTTGMFKGIETNTGSATLYKVGKVYHLKVSDDFKIPGTPAPHWQVVDKNGNVYLLKRFTIKDDKTNRDIALPKYITSISKVQVWCAFAEVLLGEASFGKNVDLR